MAVSPSHGRGHRFNPCRAHQETQENQGFSVAPEAGARQPMAEPSENSASPDVENPGTLFASRSALLRVAAVQLPRLDREDRAALRKYVERDMGR
jgi:hypothetical protein